MRSKTYAYNSVIFGALAAMYAWATTDSVALAVLALVGVSVVGFVAIRALENALGKGLDAATDAATRAFQKNRDEKK